MAWTDDMIEKLRRMWKQGLTTNEIAKNLGVSKNSIVGKVHRLNLTARPSPIKKKNEQSPEKVVEKISAHDEKSLKNSKNVKKITIEPVEIKISSAPAVSANSNKNGCVPLTELDNHTCRWPLGDPRDENFCFCGKKVRSGQTYCEEHAAIAYVKPLRK